MKKNVFLSLIPLMLLASCGNSSNYHFENKSYPEGSIWNYQKDADMKLDGKGDDAHYKDLEVFSIYEPEYGVTLDTKVYFGQNGFYIYSHCDDKSVFYNEDFDLYCNDGIEMHICVDPDSAITLSNLQRGNRVNSSMLQIRSDVSGRMQTWVGNGLKGSYEWTQFGRPTEVVVNIDGKANKLNAANGYSVEYFIPYVAFDLTEAPEVISFMPAFNNSSSNLDTERKWFTFKGMAHNEPSSWVRVTKDGLTYKGKGCYSALPVTGDRNDEKFLTREGVDLFEVDSMNMEAQRRATFKSFLDQTGIYLQFDVYDKALSRYHDSIWANDGIEFYIDTKHTGWDSIFQEGMHRFAIDVDNGLQSDMALTGFDDTKPYFIFTEHEVSVFEISTYSDYDYKYLYCYEVFVPYESLDIRYSPSMSLYASFAVSTPEENTYILDRKDGKGNMEPSSWLWVDKHYPKNGNEFFEVKEEGIVL